jgi:hypothetical protein
MRRVPVCLVAVLAALVAAVPATAVGMTPAPRIVGGTTVAATSETPWQVLVRPGGFLCGGSIIDANHVATAAHCVYDTSTPGHVATPGSVNVRAGILDRAISSGGQAPTVTSVAIDPLYDPNKLTHDAAVLTVSPAFTTTTGVRPIPVVDAGYEPGPLDDLLVSGWGTTAPVAPGQQNPGTPSTLLQKVTVHTADCSGYGSNFYPALQVCAAAPGKDSCQGDSGGPLAVQIADPVSGPTWRLAGIVSAGVGCAAAGWPGLYTKVAAGGVHDFLLNPGPGGDVPKPVSTAPPTLSGNPAVGGRLSCAPGAWSTARDLTYQLVRSDATVLSSVADLAVTVDSVGFTVRCVVTATNISGSVSATSDAVSITFPPPPPAPAPAPTPAPATPTAQAAQPTQDLLAPTAQIASVHCTRTTCLLQLRVADAAPSAGLAAVQATVTTTYRTRCGKRKRPCTRKVTQKLQARPTGLHSYRIATPKLPRGKHVFAVVASDLAGNRQAVPTTAKRTT